MKYALVFSLLALTLLVNAYLAEAWWTAALLAWPGLALALVACAYWCNAPMIFGKRPDGRTAWPNHLLLLPYVMLTRAVWLITCRLGREPAWHRIDERLIVGRRLLPREVPAGLATVLDLTCEFPETPRLRGPHYICLPMLDAAVVDAALIARAIERVAAAPGTLFIHCAQGHGRTGLIAALVLSVRTPGLTPDQALAKLIAIRPGIGLSRAQRNLLAVWDATPVPPNAP